MVFTVSPPFGGWDSAWVHCSDVDFLEFLVWLLVAKIRRRCVDANRLLRFMELPCRVLGLPLVIVSWSEECAVLRSITSRRPCRGFQLSHVSLPCFSREKLGRAHVFAYARTTLCSFSPSIREQPVQEGFPAQAFAYLAEFTRLEVLSLSVAAASPVEAKRGCERLVVNELTESSPWHTVWQHRWKRPAHINLLEGAVSEV